MQLASFVAREDSTFKAIDTAVRHGRNLLVIALGACEAVGAMQHARQSSLASENEKAPEPNTYRPPMEIQRLIDELYREELIEARSMPPEQKFLAGQQLFEAACRITLAGIRNQFPAASEGECRELLRQRLELQKRLEATS